MKRIIALSPQETAIAEHLNAWENMSLMAGVHGIESKRPQRRSEELLEMMALAGRAKEKVKKYSGGMKRRLSIAMALVSDPQVLFLDEPTIGLDPQSRRGMWEHIAGLKGNTTTVLTTHYLEEADALADRIAVIDAGKMIALGTPDELKGAISGGPVTVVEAENLTDEAIEALRQIYPEVREVLGGLEIEAEDVSVYAVGDCLRPFGVVIQSTYKKQVSLDDVFLRADRTGAARMRSMELAKRNLKEMWRDPLSLGAHDRAADGHAARAPGAGRGRQLLHAQLAGAWESLSLAS